MTPWTRSSATVAVSVALVASCLLLGARLGPSKESPVTLAKLRVDVLDTVKDPERTQRAAAALDSLQALVPVYAAYQARAATELRALLRNYEATRADFEQAAAGWEADRAALRARALAAHDAFKQALTDAEWKKLRDEVQKMLFQYPVVHLETPPGAKEEGR